MPLCSPQSVSSKRRGPGRGVRNDCLLLRRRPDTHTHAIFIRFRQSCACLYIRISRMQASRAVYSLSSRHLSLHMHIIQTVITCCQFFIIVVTEVEGYPQGGVSLLLVNWNYSYKEESCSSKRSSFQKFQFFLRSRDELLFSACARLKALFSCRKVVPYKSLN